ncbi:MAG: hypothetical protein RR364_07190 [Lachnospiraceae bacterium]
MDYSQKENPIEDYSHTYHMHKPNFQEWEDEYDRKRIKDCLRPKNRAAMELVEEVCDSLEYQGSMMYDEYPDKELFIRYCREIEERVSSRQPITAELIECYMMNEFDKRRCRNRRCCCWW